MCEMDGMIYWWTMNFNNIAVLNIHDFSYACIINGISKSKTVNLLQYAYLSKKSTFHYKMFHPHV